MKSARIASPIAQYWEILNLGLDCPLRFGEGGSDIVPNIRDMSARIAPAKKVKPESKSREMKEYIAMTQSAAKRQDGVNDIVENREMKIKDEPRISNPMVQRLRSYLLPPFDQVFI
jgi:hypothetical protein